MAKRTLGSGSVLVESPSDEFYARMRAQLTQRLSLVLVEQERLQEMLAHLPTPGSPDWNGKTPKPASPLVPESGREEIPTPKRRGWSPEAREAQRKRMKAHWRKQKAK